jgi:hypothetical protein
VVTAAMPARKQQTIALDRVIAALTAWAGS